MRRTVLFAVASLALLAAPAAPVEALPRAACAEAVGVSAVRLARVDAAMRELVQAGEVAGAVTYIARAGKIAHLSAVGMADIERGSAMREDTLFRIASQTKPVTSVAIMMLVEEGRIGLHDPLSRFLPAFAEIKVAVPAASDAAGPEDSDAAALEFVPARRQITIRDLLTHTSGVPYGFGPTAALWAEAGAAGGYYADRDEPMAALVERMARLPLDAHPGDRWIYGNSTDILGVVVETVSGQSLDEFFRERIFAPLRMNDTHFFVPDEQASRLATVYTAGASGLRRAEGTGGLDGQGHFVTGPRRAFAGGSGLVSTAADYGRFLQMVLNGGELDGVRLLSPQSVALMRSNQVGEKFAEAVPERDGLGFGLGFAVLVDPGRAGEFGSPGSFGFAGAFFTAFWLDPHEALVTQFLVQLRPPHDPQLQSRFRALAYQALVELPPAEGAAVCR
ncbi:MAG: beta-lactamase family protein [Gammaproteobacteria bacterium]|nr:beta-lactamase family protein [Gammaproteobacteria bacterium]